MSSEWGSQNRSIDTCFKPIRKEMLNAEYHHTLGNRATIRGDG